MSAIWPLIDPPITVKPISLYKPLAGHKGGGPTYRESKERKNLRERNNNCKERGMIEYFWFSFLSGIKFESLFSLLIHLKKHQRLDNYR
jgi:hypothetical protein